MHVTGSLAAALIALAALPGTAAAASYGYFDRPDETNLNSRAAVTQDVYVRGLGWAWGDVRFKPDPGTGQPGEKQARESPGWRELVPERPHDGGNAPPRNTRAKITMNVAALDLRNCRRVS